MTLSKREQKRRQMTRAGYGGVAVGVVLLAIALSAGSIILGVIGLIVLAAAGWATRTIRSL
jgi:hypothetical protein